MNAGTNVRFHMELPERIKLGEVVALRLSGINEGNIHIRRTFGVYSGAVRSFTFLSANGMSLVSELFFDREVRGGHRNDFVVLVILVLVLFGISLSSWII